MSYYYNIHRNASEINVLLSNKNPAPPLPYELQNSMSQDTWSHRVDAITQCCYRYSRPILERIWFVLAFLVMFIVPMAVNHIIFRTLYSETPSPEGLYTTRWILFAVFLANTFLFWVPLLAWKIFGNRQVKKLISEWQKLDRVAQPNTYLPVWKVSTPGIFRSRAVLRISIPPRPAVTSFDAKAPLPPYINAPGYTAPAGPPPLGYATNEKTPFEELNLKSAS